MLKISLCDGPFNLWSICKDLGNGKRYGEGREEGDLELRGKVRGRYGVEGKDKREERERRRRLWRGRGGMGGGRTNNR